MKILSIKYVDHQSYAIIFVQYCSIFMKIIPTLHIININSKVFKKSCPYIKKKNTNVFFNKICGLTDVFYFSEKSLKYSLSFKRRFQKNNDLGGFHLHLFYFAFVYQFYPRMTTLEDSVSKTREPPTPTPTPGIDYLLCFEK